MEIVILGLTLGGSAIAAVGLFIWALVTAKEEPFICAIVTYAIILKYFYLEALFFLMAIVGLFGTLTYWQEFCIMAGILALRTILDIREEKLAQLNRDKVAESTTWRVTQYNPHSNPFNPRDSDYMDGRSAKTRSESYDKYVENRLTAAQGRARRQSAARMAANSARHRVMKNRN